NRLKPTAKVIFLCPRLKQDNTAPPRQERDPPPTAVRAAPLTRCHAAGKKGIDQRNRYAGKTQPHSPQKRRTSSRGRWRKLRLSSTGPANHQNGSEQSQREQGHLHCERKLVGLRREVWP